MLEPMDVADGLILSGHDVALVVAAALNLTLAANARNGLALEHPSGLNVTPR
jgi:hypothetical protein